MNNHPRRTLIIWLASILHLMWAGLLMVSSDPLGATPLHGMWALLGSRILVITVLIACAIIAIYGTLRPKWFWLNIPQQMLLLFSAARGIIAAITGVYADGVAHPHLFILADQLPSILLAPLYTWFVLRGDRDY